MEGGRKQLIVENKCQSMFFKSKNILNNYKVDIKALSYWKDWPKIAQTYYNANKRVSRNKIERLYNFCNKGITFLENNYDQSKADDTKDDTEDEFD